MPGAEARDALAAAVVRRAPWMVGRCRLIVSNPELKARAVSALETKM